MSEHTRAVGALGIWTALIAAVDQGIKGLVMATLPGKSHILLPGFFELVYKQNDGAAFSLLHGTHISLLLALNLLVLAFFIYLIRPYRAMRSGRIAAVLVLGGALGNLIDRVLRHYVVDYLYFHIQTAFSWPVFNLADAFVVAGVVLLVWLILQSDRHRDAKTPGGEPA